MLIVAAGAFGAAIGIAFLFPYMLDVIAYPFLMKLLLSAAIAVPASVLSAEGIILRMREPTLETSFTTILLRTLLFGTISVVLSTAFLLILSSLVARSINTMESALPSVAGLLVLCPILQETIARKKLTHSSQRVELPVKLLARLTIGCGFSVAILLAFCLCAGLRPIKLNEGRWFLAHSLVELEPGGEVRHIVIGMDMTVRDEYRLYGNYCREEYTLDNPSMMIVTIDRKAPEVSKIGCRERLSKLEKQLNR